MTPHTKKQKRKFKTQNKDGAFIRSLLNVEYHKLRVKQHAKRKRQGLVEGTHAVGKNVVVE